MFQGLHVSPVSVTYARSFGCSTSCLFSFCLVASSPATALGNSLSHSEQVPGTVFGQKDGGVDVSFKPVKCLRGLEGAEDR